MHVHVHAKRVHAQHLLVCAPAHVASAMYAAMVPSMECICVCVCWHDAWRVRSDCPVCLPVCASVAAGRGRCSLALGPLCGVGHLRLDRRLDGVGRADESKSPGRWTINALGNRVRTQTHTVTPPRRPLPTPSERRAAASTTDMSCWITSMLMWAPVLVLAAPIYGRAPSVESLAAPVADPCAAVNCSGTHGSCIAGSCVCHTLWQGLNCEEPACPRSCSGHGSCLHGTCYCSHGWAGIDCSVPEVRCAHDCSGRGHGCQAGRCVCMQGWTGDDCSVPSEACPNGEGCSNHGKCSRGACMCDEGFGGDRCELMLCANDCHHRGYCAAPGRCVCHGGWRGASCEIRSGCAGFTWANGRWVTCSGHGACNEHGECECERGWKGPGCAEGVGRYAE